MADIKLNFSSQWPTVQVARVFSVGVDTSEATSYPYAYKYKHNLGYPPLAVVFGENAGIGSYLPMAGCNVDETYVYVNDEGGGWPEPQTVVVYTIDISQAVEYPIYEEMNGDVLTDTDAYDLDLRQFLLHSRAVGPMALSVDIKNFTIDSTATMTQTYTHALDYPIFQFGYQRVATEELFDPAGMWISVPLAGQAWPVLQTDGFTATQSTIPIDGSYDGSFMWIPGTGHVATDIGSIITLRNPAIITNNTVEVTL